MAKFTTRRHGDPVFVKALREGVSKIASQKQCPNEDRIVRALQNEYEWSKADILKQLKLAVKDGFLHQVTAISSHGSTKGIPQTAYRVRLNEVDEVRKEKKLFLLESRNQSEVKGTRRAAVIVYIPVIQLGRYSNHNLFILNLLNLEFVVCH